MKINFTQGLHCDVCLEVALTAEQVEHAIYLIRDYQLGQPIDFDENSGWAYGYLRNGYVSADHDGSVLRIEMQDTFDLDYSRPLTVEERWLDFAPALKEVVSKLGLEA